MVVNTKDWSQYKYFEIEDFKRIKDNIYNVCSALSSIYGNFEIVPMGDDLTYKDYYDYRDFNAFEDNIEKICEYAEGQPTGNKQVFYPNGKFISRSELNRIESILAEFDGRFEEWEAGRQRLGMTLGSNRKTGF